MAAARRKIPSRRLCVWEFVVFRGVFCTFSWMSSEWGGTHPERTQDGPSVAPDGSQDEGRTQVGLCPFRRLMAWQYSAAAAPQRPRVRRKTSQSPQSTSRTSDFCLPASYLISPSSSRDFSCRSALGPRPFRWPLQQVLHSRQLVVRKADAICRNTLAGNTLRLRGLVGRFRADGPIPLRTSP